jgi:hypothetical protein
MHASWYLWRASLHDRSLRTTRDCRRPVAPSVRAQLTDSSRKTTFLAGATVPLDKYNINGVFDEA